MLDAFEQLLLQAIAAAGRATSIVSAWPARQQEIHTALSRMEGKGLIKRHEDAAGYLLTNEGRAQLSK